jgi:hypothetical protein
LQKLSERRRLLLSLLPRREEEVRWRARVEIRAVTPRGRSCGRTWPFYLQIASQCPDWLRAEQHVQQTRHYTPSGQGISSEPPAPTSDIGSGCHHRHPASATHSDRERSREYALSNNSRERRETSIAAAPLDLGQRRTVSARYG